MTTKRQHGYALAMILMVVGVLAIMIAASLALANVNKKISSNDSLSTQALNVAQAGNAFWKAELVSLYKYMLENFDDYEDDIAELEVDVLCGNYFAIGLDLNRNGDIDAGDVRPGGKLPVQTIGVGSNSGQADVTFSVNGSSIVLDAKGSFGGAKARVQEAFSIGSINIWNNAVFAQTGAANATIRGRAEIRGSVHILGDSLGPNDMALDVTGSFGLGNTYENLNASLKVDSSVMGLTVPHPADLCATVRVRSGYIQMGGSSTLGYSDSTTSNSKMVDNLHGIYTNHGVKGGIEGSNVFSKNGKDAKYDAGNSFVFPKLNDQVTIDGITSTQAQALRRNSLVLSVSSAGVLNPEDDRARFKVLNATQPWLRADSEGYYLTQDCFNTPLFKSNHNGSWAYFNPVTPIEYAEKLLPFALALTGPLAQPIANTWNLVGHHRAGHASGNSNTGGTTGGTTGGGVSTATGFVLEQEHTPDFSCKKYKMSGSSPNPANDTVVTEVVWRKDGASSVSTSSGNFSFGDNTLYIGGTGGVVTFLGQNLTITGNGGANSRITYKGKGILFAESRDLNADGTPVKVGGVVTSGGTIDMEIDFLPAVTERAMAIGDNGKPSLSAQDNTFPATATIGLVARNTIVTSGSQNRFTVGMYAQESVDITMQTLVAGGIVTQTFDAGSQVPTVLYTNNLAEYLPKFMPGLKGTGVSLTDVSWIRR